MPLKSEKTTLLTSKTVDPKWMVIDADGQILGRLATKVATYLMGKHKPAYTPHVDSGDFVIVINCEKIRVTGRKLDQTTHDTYSGYPGGLKQVSRRELHEEKPEQLVSLAIQRMLPKSSLGRKMIKKLKVYKGSEHPHGCQNPVQITVS